MVLAQTHGQLYRTAGFVIFGAAVLLAILPGTSLRERPHLLRRRALHHDAPEGQGAASAIRHLGAKKNSIAREAIEDPDGLLEWLGPDRASIGFPSPGSVAARTAAVQHIVRQWGDMCPRTSRADTASLCDGMRRRRWLR